jgi:hypothetical protein
MDHIMLDLETMGKRFDAPIVSVGACYFDPDTGEIGKRFFGAVDMADAFQYGRANGDTVRWWLGQSDDARQALIKGRHPLRLVLEKFEEFYREGGQPCVWGNGAAFDIPITEYAYIRCLEKQAPWDFWKVRDCRTIKDLASPLMKEPVDPFKGTAHNALDDALHQAAWVSKMWQALRGNLPPKPVAKNYIDDDFGI